MQSVFVQIAALFGQERVIADYGADHLVYLLLAAAAAELAPYEFGDIEDDPVPHPREGADLDFTGEVLYHN
jgi:hypothetical protein